MISFIIFGESLENPENRFETDILHVGINGSNTDVVTDNNTVIAKEGENYGKKTSISGLTISNRLHSDFINAVNNAMK